ncbi:MAG TPA: hypothetical protein VM409_01670 [Chloroflexia bacterium]|nr:hypothetical protein [Chloroflexia bacterium]
MPLRNLASRRSTIRSAGTIRLGRFAGVIFTAEPSSLLGSVVLWMAVSAVGLLLRFSPATAIFVGLGGLLLHWLAVLLHQGGHMFAARRTGYPITGIRLWWVLSSSVYPPDEPDLPSLVHAQRALGGPLASLLLGVISLLPLLVIPSGTPAWWLALFFCVDHLLTFFVGSLLPLGFTDGSTLLALYSKG